VFFARLCDCSSRSGRYGKRERVLISVEGVNCATCHYLDEKKLVGPGMQDVTKRHTQEWLKDSQKVWSDKKHPEIKQLRKLMRKKRNRFTSRVKSKMKEEKHQNLMEFLKSLETE
jgi:cytochrome c2